MEFARKQLEKYGWSEGKGLGKNENGISKALKPKLKRNVTGVGHDAGSDFTDHWWTDLYNKAATNILVEEKNGKTKKIKTVDTSDFIITNNKWQLKKKNKDKDVNTQAAKYDEYFVKTEVLNGGTAKIKKLVDSESESDDEMQGASKMTDEELFAACEGRTVHKGARHGLTAQGKLSRIEQQEKLMLTLPKYEGYSHAKIKKKATIVVEPPNSSSCISANDSEENNNKNAQKKIKKKSAKPKNALENCNSSEFDNELHVEEVTNIVSEGKQVFKKKKRKLECLDIKNEKCGVLYSSIDSKKASDKRRKLHNSDNISNDNSENNEMTRVIKIDDNDIVENTDDGQEFVTEDSHDNVLESKKRKKTKNLVTHKTSKMKKTHNEECEDQNDLEKNDIQTYVDKEENIKSNGKRKKKKRKTKCD